MSLIGAHQLSQATRQAMRKARRVRVAKAELALLRIQSLLGLSDNELVYAAKRVAELDVVADMPPNKP